MQFFFAQKNKIQGDHPKQRDAFVYMYRHCVTISKTASGTSAQSYLGQGMRTSITKLIDNAIVVTVAKCYASNLMQRTTVKLRKVSKRELISRIVSSNQPMSGHPKLWSRGSGK